MIAVLLAACIDIQAQTEAPVIRNNMFWNTVDGAPIYSQGGGIFRFKEPGTGKERYYWYGVHYRGAEIYREKPIAKVDQTGFVSITCYVSDNLVDWTFVGDVADTQTIQRGFWVGRLGVAYVPEAKKYAIFVQYNSEVMVLTCDTPTGKYEVHDNINMTSRIGTSNTGDQTVFTDEDTGKSYLVYSYGSGRNRIYLSEIGYKDGKVTLLDCQQIFKGAGREGNCMFKYKGKYYMCASNLYGWNASDAYYLEAENIYGPYLPANEMLVMPGATDDYAHVTQTGFFYTVRGSKQETVIYCGDRWSDFAGNGNGYNQWCPISFVDGKPYFNSLSEWHLNEATGEWAVGKNNNYVKNPSFDADRVAIPSAKKPVQDFVKGWVTEIIAGNPVAVGSESSPVLNANNTPEDRAVVMGNKCLNISDKVDFKRKISQQVTSSPVVPLPDGQYRLTLKVKGGGQFNQFYVYAESNGTTSKFDIKLSSEEWQDITLDNINVRNGKVEVGFYADGKANAWSHVDDLMFVKVK